MSYILDALRRAEAERSRGAVPGLHAQSLPTDGQPAARNVGPLIWAAGAAGALVVAVVVVLVFAPWRSAGTAPPVAETGAAAPRRVLAQPPRNMQLSAELAQGELPPAQPGAIVPAARPVEPPIVRGNAPAMPDTRQQADEPPSSRAPRESLADRATAGRVATLEPAAAVRAAIQPPVEHYGAPLPTAPAAMATRAATVPGINDLPPELRAQLPRLVVGGAIYSDTPSARMVILNGQVFHEGDKPAADTVLEQIRMKSAILSFRGQRYEVTF
jgi:general secretion pathway protein B